MNSCSVYHILSFWFSFSPEIPATGKFLEMNILCRRWQYWSQTRWQMSFKWMLQHSQYLPVNWQICWQTLFKYTTRPLNIVTYWWPRTQLRAIIPTNQTPTLKPNFFPHTWNVEAIGNKSYSHDGTQTQTFSDTWTWNITAETWKWLAIKWTFPTPGGNWQ